MNRFRFSSIPFATEYNAEKDFPLLFEPENKLTLLISEEYISFVERLFIRDGKPSWMFLDEQLRKQANTFAVPRFSPFFDEVKNILQKLVEGGFWIDNKGENPNIVYNRLERTNNEVSALVLDANDLAIGFLLCIILLVLSGVVFFCELSSPIIIHLAKTTRDLLIYINVIRIVAKMRTN